MQTLQIPLTEAPLAITLLLLFLAHLLGDFVFQPSKWVRIKAAKGARSRAFWWHILIHGALSWLFIFKLEFWPWALAIMLLHGVIDQYKFKVDQKTGTKITDKRRMFWWDQFLHLTTLLLIGFSWASVQLNPSLEGYSTTFDQLTAGLSSLWTWKNILLLTLTLFLTSPAAIMIRMLISGWTPSYNNQLETDSLKNAGTYIGILERLFVFTFIICGHFEAIGFLLAAKSIFRFGDLKAAADRKLTEYVMIGTLISFSVAILAAIIYTNGQLG